MKRPKYPGIPKSQNLNLKKAISKKDDKRILELRSMDMSYGQISKQVGHSQELVYRKCLKEFEPEKYERYMAIRRKYAREFVRPIGQKARHERTKFQRMKKFMPGYLKKKNDYYRSLKKANEKDSA